MEACRIPLTVKLPEYINRAEFLRCNLNPVVVLTDLQKLPQRQTLEPPRTPPKNSLDKTETHSISADGRPKKLSRESFKIKNDDSETSSTLSNRKRFKSMERKRETWDPSFQYEIEEIVGYHRDKQQKMWYIIKWKNWPSEYNTFEPIENLTGCHYFLMRYFETSKPKRHKLRKKNNELLEALKQRNIYKRLHKRGFKAKDIAVFTTTCPEADALFQTKDINNLEKHIRLQLNYIIRCLVGMDLHEDPRLHLRGQNYKFLLMLIKARRRQLRRNAIVQKQVNSLEETEIVIENNVDLEKFPKLNYIVDLKPGKNVVLPKEPLLGCECPDGCCARSRCCGKIVDSEFAYAPNGRLRVSKKIAIYECNSLCRCPPSCPNRVVQRGRQIRLSIFKTKSCGWGVKTLETIPKGTFVCEYVGEIISDSEAVVRDGQYGIKNSGYLFNLDFFVDPKLEMFCIDATKYGNFARFINHSCDPNLVVYPVWTEGLEPNLHRLAFFARRNIQVNEEIHFDYENLDEFPDSKEKSHRLRIISNVRCQCKASNCRKWIFGNR